MTSYSLYGVNRISFTVEGDLPTDEEKADEARESMISCLSAGTARALLDNARDDDLPHERGTVHAEEWHSAAEGWELDALDDEMRKTVEYFARTLLTQGYYQVRGLAMWLAWEDTNEQALWWHDFGWALYRVGELLGHMLASSGVGFSDYSKAPSALDLDRYVFESGWVGAIDPNIIGSEEPCLLHGDIFHALREDIGIS